MAEICGDNRFELIEKYKTKLIEATNIETAKDEMAVIDSILFRFWQMGWLDKLEANVVPKSEVESINPIQEAIEQKKKENKGFALGVLNELLDEKDAEIKRLEYTLTGVMHSVDKWLDGEELEQDEVNRAITMREKTLRIIENAKSEVVREIFEEIGKHLVFYPRCREYSIDELDYEKLKKKYTERKESEN